MKAKYTKRIISALLVIVILITSIPAMAFAENSTQDIGKLELTDEYIKVTVSGENGGFLIDTLEGDKVNKSDNNKFLLYPAEDYDTSYTSIRVTRKNGDVEDYVFGRKYGFLGLSSSDVELTKEGNSIVATWSVKDITVKQKLSLLDEQATQHGMVAIEYTVKTTSDDVENVKVRIMLDTALGYQDYGVYQMTNNLNEYTTITSEKVVYTGDGIDYNGSMFAIDDAMSPKISAYTSDAKKDSEDIRPYQIAFGHWNNLASTAFDFVPDEELDFTNQSNIEFMTADSAYALYYDLGAVAKDEEVSMATNYGVFSNSTVSEKERVAINFTSLPSSMKFNEAEDAYLPQVGNTPGDIKLQMLIENISGSTISSAKLVIKTQNSVLAYRDWKLGVPYESEMNDYTQTVSGFSAGQEVTIDAYFKVSPIQVSEYRRFEVLMYDTSGGSELTEDKLLGSREFYVFCPGKLGEVVAFNSIAPQVIYNEGSRQLFLSGNNFALMKDTTAYSTILHPVAGGDDVVIPSKDVVVDSGSNTMYIMVQEEMVTGGYQVIFDWNEAGKENTTSSLLQFQVTDAPKAKTPVYGLATIEKGDGFTDANPTYKVGVYQSEKDYKEKQKDPANNVYLEFRGNFGVRYDDNGNIAELKATSIADVEGNITDTINISNCLDVEDGYVSIYVNDAGTTKQCIDIDIDGKVYTTNARTKVWTGVCAITSFENGELSKLIQYKSDASPAGDIENSIANTNAITLLWPGAASTAQTLAGMIFEFRYCQFGMMATEPGTVTDSTPKKRVISFGAEMSPDFLLPKNFDYSRAQTSPLEVVQLGIAKKNYTASQLRDVQSRFAADQAAWERAQSGTLNLCIRDILFGGGFIGFSGSIEVGIPEYFSGIPSVKGKLDLKILPATGYWKVGVEGEASFLTVIKVEAALTLMQVDGIAPGVDKIYFYCEGNYPGINVDGCGIFWVRGLGGGMEGVYESLYVASKVPPISLLLSGKFALFSLMEARADMKIGARGFEINLSELGIGGIELIEQIGLSTYWYPKFKMKASMGVNILDIIKGGGYIALEENTETNKLFWEGFATASVQTPYIPLIGTITIGSADLGLNASKIWGALHVIGLDMGVTYFWGGDVDFAFGKYDAPEPTYPIAAFTTRISDNAQTGEVLFMSVGTNAVLAAEALVAPLTDTDTDTQLNATAEAGITSSIDRMTHVINLGEYKGYQDMALTINYSADSLEDAKAIAQGDKYGNAGIRIVTEETPGTEYELKWLDNSKNAEEQTDANALLAYDEKTKQANVTISFTDTDAYNRNWKLTSRAQAELALYEMKHMAGLNSADYTYNSSTNKMQVNWQGELLEDIESINIYAVDENDNIYTLYNTEDYSIIAGGMANATTGNTEFEVPAELPTGKYTIKVTAINETKSVNDIVEASTAWEYVNPNQPANPTINSVKLGGDYSIDVDVTNQTDYEGYIATIYEEQVTDGDSKWVETDFNNIWIEPDENKVLPELITVGGHYNKTTYKDKDGNIITESEAESDENSTKTVETIGLEKGKKYKVGLIAHKTDSEGNVLFSKETLSEEIEMQEPKKPNVTIKAQDSKSIEDISQMTASIDVVNTNEVIIDITSDMPISGNWSLDDGVEEGTFEADTSGTITLKGLEEDGGLVEGEHSLNIYGENDNGDAFSGNYRFKVDTTAPRLQISSPIAGGFFAENVEISGLSEPKSTIYISLDGEINKQITVDANGEFATSIQMNSSELEQTISLYAKDIAGNETNSYDIKLTNAIIGAHGTSYGIYLNGVDYTYKNIPAGAGGLLELYAVANDKKVLIPADSFIGRQAEWSVKTVEGSASLQNMQLVTADDVNGMLTVEVDKKNVAAVLGNATDDSVMHFDVNLPSNTVGYTIETEDDTYVKYDSDFNFTLKIAEGYSKTDEFAVKVNGVELDEVDGVYTIKNIHSDENVTVEGVADITAPDVKIKISDKEWKEFLNSITFGIFFKETQSVTITATDLGSKVNNTKYYVSKTQKTLDEIKALEADKWKSYEEAFTIEPNSENVIYAMVSDNAGNIAYVSSDGVVLDNVLPVISGIEDGKTYYGDTTVYVSDEYIDKVLVDDDEISVEAVEDSQEIGSNAETGTGSELEQTTSVDSSVEAGTTGGSESSATDTSKVSASESLMLATNTSSGSEGATLGGGASAGGEGTATRQPESKKFTIEADNKEHTIKVIDKSGNSTEYTIGVYKVYEVKFIVDNEVYKTVNVNYGHDLEASAFPEIPEKTGHTDTAPVWDKNSVENVKEDVVIRAVYTPNEYQITLPSNPIGYTINTTDDTNARYGDTFEFTVDIKDGYSIADELDVYVNGIEISPVNDVYTILSVQSDIEIKVEGVEDITAPTASINIKTNSWKKFLNNITFKYFFKETQEVEIVAEDAGSGINKAYYYISDKELTTEELETVQWKVYSEKLSLVPDKKAIIYAKVVDNASNITYINSDGIVLDSTLPVITGVENGGVYEESVTVSVQEENIATITVDDKVIYDANATDNNEIIRQFTLEAADDKQVITVTDKAGNKISLEVTVNKKQEVIPTPGPTQTPSTAPSASTEPSQTPSAVPSASAEPSQTPSAVPSASAEPSQTPSAAPSASAEPTQNPSVTVSPTAEPTKSPEPTRQPEDTQDDSDSIEIYYHTDWDNTYIHYSIDNGEWTSLPGAKMQKSDKVGYEYIKISVKANAQIEFCFNDGNGTWDNNGSNNYTLSSGVYYVKDGVITREDETASSQKPVETQTPQDKDELEQTEKPKDETVETKKPDKNDMDVKPDDSKDNSDKKNPFTGDSNAVIWWIAAAFVSGGGIVLLVWYVKKRRVSK